MNAPTSRPRPPGASPRTLGVLGVLVLLLAAMVAAVGLTGSSAGAASAGPDQGHPRTVIEVSGDAANGFEIHYLGGGATYPPTDSEARAECNEYDTRVARVRCRTEVATWYRELAVLQRALDYAHAH